MFVVSPAKRVPAVPAQSRVEFEQVSLFGMFRFGFVAFGAFFDFAGRITRFAMFDSLPAFRFHLRVPLIERLGSRELPALQAVSPRALCELQVPRAILSRHESARLRKLSLEG
jgi:hypothetical protein